MHNQKNSIKHNQKRNFKNLQKAVDKPIPHPYNIPYQDNTQQHTNTTAGYPAEKENNMAITSRKNATVKALQSHMAHEKKHDTEARLEWEMACNTNTQRGQVWDQTEINAQYSRRSNWDDAQGATKVCHLRNHNGDEFKYIVVKRYKRNGWEIQGNQLVAEINCWQELAETADADLLCPILKYFTSKSDKVADTSETMKENVVIIAQKAVYVSNVYKCCQKAYEMNKAEGKHGERPEERLEKMKSLSRRRHWFDVMREAEGNCGVIYDYATECYKAVVIDYAL